MRPSLDRRTFVQFAGAALAFPAVHVRASVDWQPSRPITIIVPWGAGGSTDQVTRLVAPLLEKALNQKVNVVNQPGSAGATGTKAAMEAAKDGYTWVATSAHTLGTYKLLGSVDSTMKDWQSYVHVAHVPVLSVNADQPFQTAMELIEALRAKPGSVSVGTAGVASSGHAAIEEIAQVAKVNYRHMSFESGVAAANAVAAGQAQSTTTLAAEQVEHFRSKKLRPLAVVGDKALDIEGVGTIPALSQSLAGIKMAPNLFGIFLPKGVPDNVVSTMDAIWAKHIEKDPSLRKYARERGALYMPAAGSKATAAIMPSVIESAWAMHAAGRTKVSPETIGLAKP